jgi:hypothetical protein
MPSELRLLASELPAQIRQLSDILTDRLAKLAASDERNSELTINCGGTNVDAVSRRATAANRERSFT